MKKLVNILDKIEDKVRGMLSRHPLIYALLGAVGIVMLWRGIWHTVDAIPLIGDGPLNGPISIVIGLIILLITGIFVSHFVGNRIILTGLRGEKKFTDKTIEEIEDEEKEIERNEQKIEKTLEKIQQDISEIKKEL